MLAFTGKYNNPNYKYAMATLKVLRIGDKSDDVKKWQYFLFGQKFYNGEIDGDFGIRTQEATIKFQKQYKLQPDGVVGNKSYGAAMLLGFGATEDTVSGKHTDKWPLKPNFKPLLTDNEKRALFGNFTYVPDPLPKDKERIKVTDNWEHDNLIMVDIPQLVTIKGSARVYFHEKAAAQLQKMWSDWEEAGLMHLILTWGGSYNPRFIRGSRTTLSNHAFGTAFDINIAWNPLGAVPALVGQKGSVRELVEIANKNGFYWGGHFSRLDGMHFEVAKIL